MRTYAMWRHMLGQSVVIGSGADADGNGQIDEADFAVWRANFGNASPGQGSAQLNAKVPEPATPMLSVLAALVMSLLRSRPRHGVCSSA